MTSEADWARAVEAAQKLGGLHGLVNNAGIVGFFGLSVREYPDVAPPVVNIRATYPGASAATVENSVTQIIEQQLSGIDGLLYFASTSTSTRRRRPGPSRRSCG